jgi:uncharacterized protein YjdB
MKTRKQRTFGSRARARAFAAIIAAGLIVTGCETGNEVTKKDNGAVTGVTLDQAEIGLGMGNVYTLTATVLPADAKDKTVTWSSSKTAIATVDNDGKVTAKSLGTAVITVTAKNGKKATCVVTVGDVDVTGVSLNVGELALEIGETHGLVHDVQPGNASFKTVDWSSDDKDVATVGEITGTVTAVAVGTATITVTTRNGGFTATCTVAVSNVSVKSVTLDKRTLYLEAGDDETLQAAVLPERAFDKTVTWSSSKTAIATVDNTGKVTAVANGTAIITATSNNGKEASCTVIVAPIPVESVTIPTEFYVAVGGRKTLTPTVLPDYLNPVDKTVTWSSDNDGVATVNTDGIVTGVAEGTATITVKSNKDGTKTATCTVTVDLGMLAYMKLIPAGEFTMGSPLNEPERETDETGHSVTLSGFYMYETPVLIWDYYQVTGDFPTWFFSDYIEIFGDDWILCPVDGVTWYDAVEFCNKLSELEGLTPVYTINNRQPATGYPITGLNAAGTATVTTVACNWTANGYRLPTEAEWEYACRAGTKGPFNTNTGDNIIPPVVIRDGEGSLIEIVDFGEANYHGEYPYNNNDPGGYIGMPVIPYLYTPNDFGLYTMHGNLEEWCWDLYGAYQTTPQTNPRGPSTNLYGPSRVVRGGSFWDYARFLRSAARWTYLTNEAYDGYIGLPWVGFRFVRNAPGEPGGRAVNERGGTAKRERVLPQGLLQDILQAIPQGKRTLDRNSASRVKAVIEE